MNKKISSIVVCSILIVSGWPLYSGYLGQPDGKNGFEKDYMIQSFPVIGTNGTISVGSCDNKLFAIGNTTLPEPPVADAGPDQVAIEGATVRFDGTGSTTPNGTIDSYEWDFDADVDSDGDGIPDNDVDASGAAPAHMYGDDGVYTVTLNINASIKQRTEQTNDIDCVFCMDSSRSMRWNDPNDLRITEAQNMVFNHFELPDRGAVVDFDDNAFLVPEDNQDGDHLSSNYEIISANLGLIDSEGGTVLWRGMNESNEELRNYGNSSLVPIIILLTDAEQLNQDPDDIPKSYREAAISASHNIRVFTIGLSVPPWGQSERLLKDIASTTGGKYFPASNPSHFREIYNEIADIAKNTSYVRLSDTDTMQVTVKNVAPELELVGMGDLIFERVARYNGTGDSDDKAWDIAIDGPGNVYVTGSSRGAGTFDDYVTIAYDPEGEELWTTRYNGPGGGNDGARAMALDAQQNVYVTGLVDAGPLPDGSPDLDFGTVKYDKFGNELWVRHYDWGSGSADSAAAIATDTSGDVIVSGNCKTPGTYHDIVTVKYDRSGALMWMAAYNGSFNNEDCVMALTTDSQDNVFITGYSYGDGTNKDIITIKYDSTGNTLWVNRYDGPESGEDSASAIAVDPAGNVYVTGYLYGWPSRQDYCTIKYGPSGNFLWMRRYMGFGEVRDYATAIALDSEQNVYVTGRSYDIKSDFDFVTVKYNTYGNVLWTQRFNGGGNFYDNPVGITVDSSQNVYVAGEAFGNLFSWNYALVVYDPNGNEVLVKEYDGKGAGDDHATAMEMDAFGNVYITGLSHQRRFGNYDYATTKYSRPFILECKEGSSVMFSAIAMDPGSDDIIFTCQWGDGTADTVDSHYNNGLGPEPRYDPSTNEMRSSGGLFPWNVTGAMSHTYGDDGRYAAILTVEDDDGGYMARKIHVVVKNSAPVITRMAAEQCNEGSVVLLEAEAMDSGSDDLTYSWEIECGPVINNTYFNNGISSEPVYNSTTNEIRSSIGNYPFSTFNTVAHCYGDDYCYKITLTVTDDDGGTTSLTSTVLVNNTAPFLTEIVMPYPAEEGISSIFRATAQDYGSDDLTFVWDFGDSSPVVNNTYFNNGTAPDIYPSPDGTYPFIAQDTVGHVFGDDYDYTLTLTVTDDDGGITIFTTTVVVENVAPEIEPFGPFAIDEGTSIDITGIATDQGSDDLTFTWEIDGVHTSTNTYFNDGMGADPYPSPEGVYPFSITEEVSQTFADDGNYSIVLTVMDDDGGTSTYKTYILVNNLQPIITSFNHTTLMVNAPRTVGYWGHQCEVDSPYGDHTGIMQEWIDEIAVGSQVFSWITAVEDVNQTIQFGDASEMVIMAKRQLMGVWLNFVSGKLHPATQLHMPNLTTSETVWEAILEIEDVILNSENRSELERVKDMADNMNNGMGIALVIIEFTASATDPGADDLIFHWDFGDGKLQDNFYPNPGGVLPFTASDFVEHSYFSKGTFTVTLTVSDDDGGTSTITKMITF